MTMLTSSEEKKSNLVKARRRRLLIFNGRHKSPNAKLNFSYGIHDAAYPLPSPVDVASLREGVDAVC